MNNIFNVKPKRTANRMFVFTLLSTLVLLGHGAVYAQDTDRLSSLERMDKSVKEWNLLKANIKELSVKNKIKETLKELAVNNKTKEILDETPVLHEKTTVKLDDNKVKSLDSALPMNNELPTNNELTLNNEQLSLLEMSNSIKEWDLLKPDIKALILAQAEMNKLKYEKAKNELIEKQKIKESQWGVQIGAYTLPKHLDLAIEGFYQKFDNLKDTTFSYREFTSKKAGGDDLFRLKIGPFSSRMIANEQCNKFMKKGFNCFPTKLTNNNMIVNQ